MEFRGRLVLQSEVREEKLSPSVIKIPTMKIDEKTVTCLRCGKTHLKAEVQLQIEAYYCPSCILLGRVQSNHFFYTQEMEKREKILNSCSWQGVLSDGQERISKEILIAVEKRETLLVHAVTGAGKTEMLFEGIEHALSIGQAVCIASPRVDVCVELYPRLKSAFQSVDVCLLYGKGEEEYRNCEIVLCTTHQLLRFYHAFDVLIIDEIDAFPFVDNAELNYAVTHAKKKDATLIYLTATPTKKLLDEEKSKQLRRVILPARYHRKSLVTPTFVWCNKWEKQVNDGKLPRVLKLKMQELLADGFPFLIFVPTIELMKKLVLPIQKAFPKLVFTTVYAEDEKRLEKVQQMRDGKLQLLITSTILERGVTFAGVSVIVFGANHRVFKSSALVQISGRVGRNIQRPNGKLYFLHDGRSRAMVEAKKQIVEMNRLAVERGMIDE
ncbi:MAG: DEAD/DEAH box helicase [Lactobacillales bacterium]|nr:DEAD/DEAH box helicase [Lactobacillales bacterium]